MSWADERTRNRLLAAVLATGRGVTEAEAEAVLDRYDLHLAETALWQTALAGELAVSLNEAGEPVFETPAVGRDRIREIVAALDGAA